LVVIKSIITGGRVADAVYVFMECGRTVSCVPGTGCILKECFPPARRVVRARCKVEKRPSPLGRVATRISSIRWRWW
jgi:hypothetical protein